MMDYGRENTNIKVNEWVKYINKLGVGEIIINSVDNDGMESGFDLSLIRLLDNNTKCPIVISGGAGNFNHFLEATKFDYISGLSASSVFHFNKINILDLKKSLKDNKVNTVE